jgi:putative ABC transport system permease protein
MLARKLRRELWWQRSQILAITVALAIAVCCYVASRNSYLDLTQSYASLQEDLHLADWTLSVSDVDAEELEHIRNLEGVAGAEDRIVVSLPLVIPKGRFVEDKVGRVRLEGRFITLPKGHKPEVNQLLIETGSYPEKPNEVLVEKHLAEHHRLKPGDELELEVPGAPRSQKLIVSGIAVSAEYLWVSRNELDIMPSPVSFGVVWIDRNALSRYRKRPAVAAGIGALLGGGADEDEQRPKVKIEDQHEILLRVTKGHDAQAVLDRATKFLGSETVLSATSRDDLPQTEILRTDMKSLRGFSVFFPALFLIVGGSIIAVSLSRVIDSQRSIIGTMLAFGVPRSRILLHYLAFTLIVGALGSAIGIAAGIAIGKVLTRAYAEVANVPRLIFTQHEGVLIGGVAFGVLAAMVAGLLPAIRAAAMYPADAMRPPAPVLSRGVKDFGV